MKRPDGPFLRGPEGPEPLPHDAQVFEAEAAGRVREEREVGELVVLVEVAAGERDGGQVSGSFGT